MTRLKVHQATPTTEDVEGLVVEIGLACGRRLAGRGFAGADEDAVEDDDALGVLQLESLNGEVALRPRAGKRVGRVIMLGGREVLLRPRCAGFDRHNLHAKCRFRRPIAGGAAPGS